MRPAYRATSKPVGIYRSGLEATIAQHLQASGASFEYEKHVIRYTQPAKPRRYTPDFALRNGIILEAKGRFLTSDRQKHKEIKASHPELEIRFIFSNPRARLNKDSQTTYADWCERYGFQYAHALTPLAWIKEPANPKWLAALERACTK